MAERGTWDIARKISGVWTAEGTIYRPNSNLPIEQISTQAKTQLANGGVGYIVPEVLSNPSMLKLTWGYLPKTYKDQIEAYVTNLYDMRITDHNNTIYYGRFTRIRATWLVGEEDKYDVASDFEIIPLLA